MKSTKEMEKCTKPDTPGVKYMCDYLKLFRWNLIMKVRVWATKTKNQCIHILFFRKNKKFFLVKNVILIFFTGGTICSAGIYFETISWNNTESYLHKNYWYVFMLKKCERARVLKEEINVLCSVFISITRTGYATEFTKET